MNIYNIFWNSKNKGATTKKQENNSLLKKKKHFDPLICKYHTFMGVEDAKKSTIRSVRSMLHHPHPMMKLPDPQA